MSFQRRELLRLLPLAFGSTFILSRSEFDAAGQTATQPTIPPPPPAGKAAKHELTGGVEMEKVTGIGGLFFRAHDPKALAHWYQQNLGVSPVPTKAGESSWEQEAGATAFSPFPETSGYFGDPNKVWMINFRVRDLDKMIAQLRGAGIEVKDPQDYAGIGRFARLHDPEGNPIELWQPAK